MASYHTTADSSPLTKAEREVVLTIADDEGHWAIFTDSRRLGGKLRKLAARWGVEPERAGHGWAFTLPLKAIRFAGPRTPTPEGDSRPKAPGVRGPFGRRARLSGRESPGEVGAPAHD